MSSSETPAVVEEIPVAEHRTKKREPGKISKAIKLGVVGDGLLFFFVIF